MPELQSLIAKLTSGDDEAAEAAATGLARLENPPIDALVDLLKDADPNVRWWAIRALASFDHAAVGESLILALADPDPSVRQCAALGLRHRPTKSALAPLVHALENPDRLLARLAADALISLGVQAIHPLTEGMQSSNPAVRIESARALAAIKDQEAIPALYAALEDPSSVVRYWAEVGLERLGLDMIYFAPE